jgi:wyosine [tRNA(Phe)-imidazoG37] synthetase (radical SAM superfamily)
MDLKKHYICKVPFEYMEVHHMGVYACCPAWLPTKITDMEDVSKAWDSDVMQNIRESILNGEYDVCNEKLCPVLSELVNQKTIDSGFFVTKEDFKKINYDKPKIINYSFDRSCNLTCPTCRTNTIMANGEELDKIEWVMKEIETTYGSDLKGLYISGTADPFASKTFRKLLTNFDKKKYPNVSNIHLHTNAILFTKEMWNMMKSIQKIIRIIEVSVDAATKDTYEVVRRGGDWDVLIENLKFMATLPIGEIRISMVVQNTNFMEMEDFYNLMNNIFKGKARIFFKKIDNWGTYTNDEFFEKEIFNEDHPMFNMFLLQLAKIDKKDNCIHNFHDISLKHIKRETKFI